MHKDKLYTDKQRQEVVDILLKGGDEALHLLESGISINTRCNKGNTPFYIAEKQDNVESYKFFLEHGACKGWSWSIGLSAKDYTGLILSAIHEGRENIVKYLMENFLQAVDINKYNDHFGEGPLHKAVFSDNENLVKYILSSGADVEMRNALEETALHIAIKWSKKQEIIELLLNHGSSVNPAIDLESLRRRCDSMYYKRRIFGKEALGNSPLHYASRLGSENIVKLLLEKGADTHWKNMCGLSVLHSAVAGGNENIVKLFLDSGLDVALKDESGWTPLSYINFKCEKGISNNSNFEETIVLLLNRGANVNSKIRKEKDEDYSSDDNSEELFYENILHLACAKGYERIVKLLLDKDANFNGIDTWNQTTLYSAFDDQEGKYNETALHLAVQNDNVKILELLLNYGADITCQRKDGYVPLEIACKCGSENVVKFLFEKGADITARNTKGGTALHSAVKGGNENIVQLLLDQRPGIHRKVGPCGYNALHFAAKTGNKNLVDLVLNRGARINSKSHCNKWGNGRETALSIACVKGHEDTVKLLLERDAKIFQGTTNVLERSANERIVRILLDYGLDVDEEDVNENTALMNHAEGFSSLDQRWFNDEDMFYYYEKGEKKKVEQILDYDASVNIESMVSSALDHIENTKNLELLLEYQASINDDLSESDSVLLALNESTSLSSDDCTFGGLDYCLELTTKLLARHMVKMLSERLFVREEYLNCIDNNQNVRDFKIKCESEIIKMKEETIPDTSIFPYDILISKDATQLAAFARNEKILLEISTVRCLVKYPIYASTLNNQLRRGKWRYLLLDGVQYFFKALARTRGNQDIPRLPKDCVDMIFTHLSNKDLKRLVQVCNVPFDAEICNVEI